MAIYRAPIREMMFISKDVLDLQSVLNEMPTFSGVDVEDIEAVITEAGRFAENRIAPFNLSTDLEGCRLENEKVYIPQDLHTALKEWFDAGWLSITAEPEDGGQGLPAITGFLVNEILSSASISFGDYHGLFASGYTLLRNRGTDELKDRYFDGLLSGKTGVTQCMTEPHCGSDVGLLKTKAEPLNDGTWSVSGTKIFISAGDQDLTENIIHMVLARVVGDPAGVRGVSLFLVPKLLPNGSCNNVIPVGLEHKMGYSASATCEMSFEKATGWLLGEQGKGLVAMFDMVNHARLTVGAQGLCTAEAAYQVASEYAKERLQGRSLSGTKNADLPADPLIVHPDVRRMLLSARSFTESARALYLWLGLEVDIAKSHPDKERREEADDWLSLLTGPAKAIMSDLGFNATIDCQQVLGGHGYVRDHGIEQFVRDGRLAMIQEGANGLLAINLLNRQIKLNEGRAFKRLHESYNVLTGSITEVESLNALAEPFSLAVKEMDETYQWVTTKALDDVDELGAAGVDFQRIFGLILLSSMSLRIALAAQKKLDSGDPDDDDFYSSKIHLAGFFVLRILPDVWARSKMIRAGAAPIMSTKEERF